MASTNKDKLKELLGKIAISTNTITGRFLYSKINW